jgi:hypothetical protein
MCNLEQPSLSALSKSEKLLVERLVSQGMRR